MSAYLLTPTSKRSAPYKSIQSSNAAPAGLASSTQYTAASAALYSNASVTGLNSPFRLSVVCSAESCIGTKGE